MILRIFEGGRGINLAKSPYNDQGYNCCIIGNSGSGKSNTAAAIAEEFYDNFIPVVYCCPDGNGGSLRELGQDWIVIGHPNHPIELKRGHYSQNDLIANPDWFADLVTTQKFSIALDCQDHRERGGDDPIGHPMTAFAALLEALYASQADRGEPMALIVDEAHEFAPEGSVRAVLKPSFDIVSKMASNGRKRGVALTVATQRPTYLSKKLIFNANVRMYGMITYAPDQKLLSNQLPASPSQMSSLGPGEVYVVSPNGWGKEQIRRRRTTHLGKTPPFTAQARQRPDVRNIRQLELPVSLVSRKKQEASS